MLDLEPHVEAESICLEDDVEPPSGGFGGGALDLPLQNLLVYTSYMS